MRNIYNNIFVYSSASKSSAVASAIFVLHKKTDLISAPASCVHLIIIIFFVYFKLLGITDPLLPLENLFKKIFLGGILDQLQETFYGKPEEENGEASGIPWKYLIYIDSENLFEKNLDTLDPNILILLIFLQVQNRINNKSVEYGVIIFTLLSTQNTRDVNTA